MSEDTAPNKPIKPDGRVTVGGELKPAASATAAPPPAKPENPELAAIHASLAAQAAIVQQGPAHVVIPRREVQPDGKPKSNPVLRRRAAREKE